MKFDQPVLLISLGHTPAVVPEAFLMKGVNFRAVHVLTTEQPGVGFVREFFAQQAPQVELTVSRVANFHELNSDEDQSRFEEVLYRWILEIEATPAQRWVCVAGGFKTMSAAMQKAAAVLGAAEVFHILADSCCTDAEGRTRQPSTIDEIRGAQQDHLHWIRLGPESGWPQLRSATSREYPLEVISEQDGVRRVSARDQAFCQRLRQIVERSHHIAGAWDRLPELPFTELATWPESDLSWLNLPMAPDSAMDRSWVARLPKFELHCHLGGFATNGALLEQVRAAAQRPEDLPPLKDILMPAGWPLPKNPIGLEKYRGLGDNTGSILLRDPGCLRRQCELLYSHLLDQHVLYSEIRCSPANYSDVKRARAPWEVLEDIRETFQCCMASARASHATGSLPPCHVNLIIIGTRQSRGDYRAGISRHLALAITAAEHWRDDTSCRVVGVDLAGYEDKETRAQYFREEFAGVHRCGLALTVHAGENDDAEGIWQAVFDLNARRLGHALHLIDSPDLIRSVADRGIGVEMCPYANLQIRGFALNDDSDSRAQPPYPLAGYLQAGIRVTVNSDNIGISAATLTDNLLLTARLCPGLTRMDILRLQRQALDTAFIGTEKRRNLTLDFSRFLPKP